MFTHTLAAFSELCSLEREIFHQDEDVNAAAPSELCSVERMIGRRFTVADRIIAPTEQSSVGSCVFDLRHTLVQNHALHRAELGGGSTAPKCRQ